LLKGTKSFDAGRGKQHSGCPNKQSRNFVAQRLKQAKVLALVGLQKQKMVPETQQSLDQWNSP
jgi:hypothetical protein